MARRQNIPTRDGGRNQAQRAKIDADKWANDRRLPSKPSFDVDHWHKLHYWAEKVTENLGDNVLANRDVRRGR